jgi:S-methylmethionine-dependent homocysteine/selenocysteine methylase
MAEHRDALPQLDDLMLTDGGLETTLIFLDGFDLPDFAAFVLLDDETGLEALRRYFRSYIEVARSSASASSRRPPRGGRAPTGAPGSGTTGSGSRT